MAIKPRMMTVWHHLYEDTSGCALYRAITVLAYTAPDRHTKNAAFGKYGAAISMGEEVLTGFILPDSAEGEEIPFFLVPERDFIAFGDQTDYATPVDAAQDGIAIYGVTSSVQPPHISDGTLVKWCCFEATRELAR